MTNTSKSKTKRITMTLLALSTTAVTIFPTYIRVLVRNIPTGQVSEVNKAVAGELSQIWDACMHYLKTGCDCKAKIGHARAAGDHEANYTCKAKQNNK